MKIIIKNYLIFVLFCVFGFSCNKENKVMTVSENELTSEIVSKEKPRVEINYDNYYKEAQQYCKANNLNQDKFILIDLGVHSGLKRFFIYDFKDKKISKSYMVSHGCGANEWGRTSSKKDALISNEFDSHCSSLGKYVILDRGVSQWGIKVNYILKGKDKSNSNALKRSIVLHSWEAIPDEEVFPEGTPEGWGCPAVSNESMKEIDELLKTNKKVLMWVIKS
ncbi:murein L,D-transpeptidase catalytic domain-containing protein [Flavobacterium pectinovorum]|uniref:murein L,D-transpeptidase catalytic domain-containing protein n=1 Tax=Flavobacterium pectinovorum TaxID=29533 RepID=UPI001FAD8DC6|nr:murein L,D-transpeptidase catalytic domain family protein [Flavobacterium pectinovorum]MCI9843187.1 murein L,D-transpeptidase catalytic domain family protein [Flavobacterium pectinovorum]